MNDREIKALISLLDDDDYEVATHVEHKLRTLGGVAVPFLENEWENTAMSSPLLQKKIEDLIHDLQFKSVVERLMAWKEGGAMDLMEGFWIVSTYQYRDLTFDKLKIDFEQLFYEIWLEFRPNMTPIDQIKILNSVFFGKLKFGANTRNFHSASNSMINIVLETHKGNPISLCSIYMMVANKLGIPLFGVNLPNLFVLTFKSKEFQFYINVFNKGLVFTRNDIDNYIAQLNIPPTDIFYQPCTHLDIIKRVLRNLVLSFEKTGDDDKVKEIELILKRISE